MCYKANQAFQEIEHWLKINKITVYWFLI
jgi:hypothetical protein